MNEILVANNVEKIYKSEGEELSILKGANLCVTKGSKIAITGASGSGKSTFLNILGGIDKATGGNVIAGKWNVSELDEDGEAEYRSHFLGFVFQFHYLLKDFTALENVYLPALIAGLPKKIAIEKARSLLHDVGLEKRAEHLPAELSGGERQRAAVARSLINEPELVLADEPTGNLDPANAILIGDILFSIVDKYKKTLILVTHDMSLAKKADCVYTIRDGKIASENLR